MTGSEDTVIKQALPLLMLKASDGQIDGTTRFQKLVFLAQKGDIESIDSFPEKYQYEYEAHNYGPYSKELDEILKAYIEEGIVSKQSVPTYSGNTKIVYELDRPDILDGINIDKINKMKQISEEISSEFGDTPLFDLMDYVYDRYEEYTVNSVYR
ncbi:Panacea domain-containing protein [Natronocalculus amylovorans]|uniref:SocA family protein n=1 Tax=Natronocalculus amylovorans TaxID=2917812 RepID=A0AAE3G052_9EURY|nr:Panacea domain-containing protein [Natronocalculus amylovorans]MCL9818316.1 SocA family protein [Natronocalculus amylovorans]